MELYSFLQGFDITNFPPSLSVNYSKRLWVILTEEGEETLISGADFFHELHLPCRNLRWLAALRLLTSFHYFYCLFCRLGKGSWYGALKSSACLHNSIKGSDKILFLRKHHNIDLSPQNEREQFACLGTDGFFYDGHVPSIS